MDFSVKVDDEAFEYLRLQKGSLDRYANKRAEWHAHYEADLRDTYEGIAPHLPPTCAWMLDIGSGLGGIDVLIRRHYGGAPIEVNLLDGIEDPPVMKLHRETFNDMRVAKWFQIHNGIPLQDFSGYGKEVDSFRRRFDLVVSFGSWCFHYPPSVYLPRLCAGGLHEKSVIICDVRASKPEWMGELVEVFGPAEVIVERHKWLRCVFRPKAT